MNADAHQAGSARKWLKLAVEYIEVYYIILSTFYMFEISPNTKF